jgi:hypothetical protein
VFVVERERFVVVVDLRQVRIGEDVRKDGPAPACFGTILPFFLRFQPPCQRSWFSQSFG